MTCTSTSLAARTVAVAGCRSTTAISPKIAPGASIRANATPSRSTVIDPEASTYIRPDDVPSAMSTLPAGTACTGRSAASSSISVMRTVCPTSGCRTCGRNHGRATGGRARGRRRTPGQAVNDCEGSVGSCSSTGTGSQTRTPLRSSVQPR